MSSLDDETIAEVFACGICEDILLDPVTVSCCGRSFCRSCLQTWIKVNVRSTGIPRCPGGCAQKISFRLPKQSITLRTAVEQLFPKRLEERRKEEADAEEEICVGGFKPWEEVAASRDVLFANSALGVRQGTPGIVVDNFSDGVHLTVKFDEREDGSDLCVNVIPEVLMHPLPGGLRLGQRVVATVELILTPAMRIRLGGVGSIIGAGGGDRITVLFEPPPCPPSELEEQQNSFPYFPVSVSTRDIVPHRLLVGGFSIAQKVQSSCPLMVGTQTLVPTGCRGTVLGEFSDTRLTVLFENSEDNPGCFNILPHEIRPWCEPLDGFPVGAAVMASHNLVSMEVIVAEAGAKGVVLGAVDELHVLVAMESGRCLTVAISGLLRVQDVEETITDAATPCCQQSSLEMSNRDATSHEEERKPADDQSKCQDFEAEESERRSDEAEKDSLFVSCLLECPDSKVEEEAEKDSLSLSCLLSARPRIGSDEETTVPEDMLVEDSEQSSLLDPLPEIDCVECDQKIVTKKSVQEVNTDAKSHQDSDAEALVVNVD